MAEVVDELSDKYWDNVFFFYEGGLQQAIETILTTYDFTGRSIGMHNTALNAVMHDANVYFDGLERDNTLPPNYVNILDNITIAVALLDEAVNVVLNRFLKGVEYSVVEVDNIKGSHDYVLHLSYFPY